MVALALLVLGSFVIPVLINKSTEGERLNFIKPYLREIWTVVLLIFVGCFLMQQSPRDSLMKLHPYMPGYRGYIVCAIAGSTLLCAYWWFVGKIFTPQPIPQPPEIAWQNPAPITYGTPLSERELSATVGLPGKLSFAPDIGAILTVGRHSLRADFDPDDKAKYSPATRTVQLIVNPAPVEHAKRQPPVIPEGNKFFITGYRISSFELTKPIQIDFHLLNRSDKTVNAVMRYVMINSPKPASDKLAMEDQERVWQQHLPYIKPISRQDTVFSFPPEHPLIWELKLPIPLEDVDMRQVLEGKVILYFMGDFVDADTQKPMMEFCFFIEGDRQIIRLCSTHNT
jgi:hypothetical protein